MNIKKEPLLSELTTFKVGGPAKELIEVENRQELKEVLSELEGRNEKYMLLGNGSNLIFLDEGYDGVILKLSGDFHKIERIDDTHYRCNSGALMSKVSNTVARDSLSGFEPLGGIPGSIGGALYMNAGAYVSSMMDVVKEVEIISTNNQKISVLDNSQMDFKYRKSRLSQTGELALSTVISLTPDKEDDIKARMKDYSQRRKDKQPIELPSAGSFFKRPEGYFAGKLIEDAGLRGYSVGDIQVSEKHCGFIVNRGNGKTSDIIKLMNIVKEVVYKNSGVMLEREVRIIGYEE